MSKYEDKIVRILKNNSIVFVREKTFHDLKHGLFRYDFYCTNVDGAPAIIEMNGEQHYFRVEKFQHNRVDFLKQQEHDRQKISYALAKNIPIYIIPFWEIDKITSLADMLAPEHRARSKWHNDEIWRRRNLNK